MNGPSERIVSIQRWSIALLVAGGALNYVDRATLSVANKLIQDELGIPVAKMGLLLSAFLWAYATCAATGRRPHRPVRPA
jgi:sugar phosphate permease